MRNLLKSFVYAFRGITYCIAHERNMRIHLCFTAYMFGFLFVHDFFEVSRTQLALLFAVSGLVMALEAVNTAVEKVVDLATKEINSLAKISKDAAAGAVLIAAIGSVAVGISILYQPEAFVKMFEYYKENIPVLIGFIISFIASVIFVFAGPYGIKNFFVKHVK
ncbi:MAG: diacylglycerol kinase family protein [Clostridia bacterium]|nr:diacylglycerol kinase family protein [Clostridia bacterium]